MCFGCSEGIYGVNSPPPPIVCASPSSLTVGGGGGRETEAEAAKEEDARDGVRRMCMREACGETKEDAQGQRRAEKMRERRIVCIDARRVPTINI